LKSSDIYLVNSKHIHFSPFFPTNSVWPSRHLFGASTRYLSAREKADRKYLAEYYQWKHWLRSTSDWTSIGHKFSEKLPPG